MTPSYFQIVSMLCLVPAVITVAGIITVLLMRPLLLGKVGPNGLYGIRTPAAFQSTEAWYRINRDGAAILRGWGFFVVIVGLIGFPFALLGPEGSIFYNAVAGIVILVSLVAKTVRLLRLR